MVSVVVPSSVSSSVLSVVVLALQKYCTCTINYILYGRTMGTVQKLITLFVTLLLLLLLLLIVMYDCVGAYDETIIMLVCWLIMMSIYLLNLLSCPCSSVPPRIFTTLLSQAYMYIRVMLLIVL